jgi:predicted phosphate transport protein (TIGR00153 family)
MFSLLPREMVFFDLFEEAAHNAHQGALALQDLLEDFRNVSEKAKRIKDIEHAGDKITHTTIEKLNQTFITPLDREDIHELICRIDDILDLIDTAVARIHLYKIDKPTDDAKALARVLVSATKIICELLPKMRNLKLSSSLLQNCIEIHTQENEGDRIEQHALAALFENGHDPIFIIKWKDIYEELESATDRCEDVANVIEGIVLKNS